MLRFRSRAAVFLLLAAAAGCAHRPNTYRLIADPKPILIPPGVANPNLARRTFVADIPPGPGPCALDDAAAVQLQLRKKHVRVTVNRDALLGQPPGWLSDWGIRAETQGCARSGSGQELANLIAESVPLDPATAFRLLNANSVLRGYVDLGPENRLQVHSPILRERTPTDAPLFETSKASGTDSQLDVDLKLAPSVIGFETAWYAIRPNIGRAGYHFEPLFADRNIQGKVEHAPTPATNYFGFPPEAAFFRLLYKSDSNGVTAIVTFGATREELDRRTKTVLADPAACEKAQETCLILPHRVGVNPYLAVNVNGAEVTVPLQANVSAAIQTTGVKNPDTVLPQLSVAKPFGNKLVPVVFDWHSREILTLQLTGGEQISWQTKP
jgi:hypothetical protein